MCTNINNKKIEHWLQCRHEHRSVDLLDKMHVHVLNKEQNKDEHNSLDYWLRNYAGYDIMRQPTYLESINGFFKKQLEEYIDERQAESPWENA